MISFGEYCSINDDIDINVYKIYKIKYNTKIALYKLQVITNKDTTYYQYENASKLYHHLLFMCIQENVKKPNSMFKQYLGRI